MITGLDKYKSVFMVYDRNVEYYADKVAGESEIEASLGIDAGEAFKDMDTVLDICRFLIGMGADRDSLLLAIGGGTLTDMAGMAASIYKRGIRVAFVPTTLLSMVDAAHGGKNGVNLDGYKNVVGSFLTPEFVHTDVSLLRTLPRREFLSGAAELLKTFLIADASLYEEGVKVLSESKPDYRSLGRLIEEAVKIKEEFVAEDPYDRGVRKKLNLGHTFAHAIEWYERTHDVGDPMTHGEAVAVGIIASAKMCNEALAARLEKDFLSCGLPVSLPYSVEELMPAMRLDKKNSGGQIRYVLLEGIGEVKI